MLAKSAASRRSTVHVDGEDCVIPTAALRMLKDIMVQLGYRETVSRRFPFTLN
ncbi:MAG: hypothetical protein R3C19_23330 [Planctomycetaceae bacterium]